LIVIEQIHRNAVLGRNVIRDRQEIKVNKTLSRIETGNDRWPGAITRRRTVLVLQEDGIPRRSRRKPTPTYPGIYADRRARQHRPR
jgi:hypothetical protein